MLLPDIVCLLLHDGFQLCQCLYVLIHKGSQLFRHFLLNSRMISYCLFHLRQEAGQSCTLFLMPGLSGLTLERQVYEKRLSFLSVDEYQRKLQRDVSHVHEPVFFHAIQYPRHIRQSFRQLSGGHGRQHHIKTVIWRNIIPQLRLAIMSHLSALHKAFFLLTLHHLISCHRKEVVFFQHYRQILCISQTLFYHHPSHFPLPPSAF